MAHLLTTEAPRLVPSDDLGRNALPAAANEDAQDQVPELQPAMPSSPTTVETPNLAPQPGNVLTGVLALDLPGISASAERFFARVEDLGEELTDAHLAVELAPWLGTMAAALAASEWLRWQRSKQQALVGNAWGGEHGLGATTWTFLASEDEP
jgi:hypothetical protein